MDPFEEMLQHLAHTQGAQADQLGVSFTLNPTRLMEALAGLVAEDPLLWFKHLLQWLYEIDSDYSCTISEQPDNFYRLNITCEPSLIRQLTCQLVQSAESRLFARDPAAVMARVLVELGASAQFLHEEDRQTAVVAHPDALRLEPACQAIEHGFGFIFPLRAVTSASARFGQGRHKALGEFEAVARLHPKPPHLSQSAPITTDWPFPQPTGEDDDRLKSWDWETVVESDRGGFRWSIASWSEVFLESIADEEPFTVMRHPVQIKRGFSEHPLLGCYPASLARRLDTSARPSLDTMNLLASRVMGISWTATTPKKSVLIPVIRGVAGRWIRLEGAPAGIFLLADASHLICDATGVAVVRDEVFESWQDELVHWAMGQTQLYLHKFEEIPSIWMRQAKRPHELEQGPSIFKQIFNSVLVKVYSTSSIRKLVAKRHRELSDWVDLRGPRLLSSQPLRQDE